MADDYGGYEAIALGSSGAIVRAVCAAHARWKVFDAHDGYPREASMVLVKFQ